jgi:hypothetical protein
VDGLVEGVAGSALPGAPVVSCRPAPIRSPVGRIGANTGPGATALTIV